jgi:Flp pilus assembly protein TadG
MSHAIRRFRRAERGAAIIEFAILAPVFLLMMLGMVGYAIYFGASHSIQQLAADAVRASIPGLTTSERQALAHGFIARNAGAYLLIEPGRVSVTVADRVEDADQVMVSISYDASTLPIWNLYPPLPLPSTTIVHRATIRIGGR